MGKSKILGSGAGNVVNGIIEQYYAATNDVKANTFVEYVDKFQLENPGATTQISSKINSTSVSAVQLAENKVFVAFNIKNGYSYWSVYGVVCTINNGVVTAGTTVAINTVENVAHTARNVVALALSSTKVVVIFSNDVSETLTSAFGKVCTISGTSISVGSEKEIKCSDNYWGYAKAAALSSSSFIVVGESTNYNIYAVICTVSGSTITTGTSKLIRAASLGTDAKYDIIKLTSSKALLAYARYKSGSSSYYGTAVVVLTISGTTITTGTEAFLDHSVTTNQIALLAFSETKAVLCDYSNFSYAQIVSIAGTTVSLGTRVSLASTSYIRAMLKLNESAITFYETGVGVNVYPRAQLARISGTTITLGSTYTSFLRVASASYTSMCYAFALCTPMLVLCAGCDYSSQDIQAQLANFLDYKGIIPLTASANFLGLTMTKATKTSQGKVWTLKGE